MRKFLHHDEASGTLRLVLEDLWEGQHERTEFRVTDSNGCLVRRGQGFDGRTVYGDAFSGYWIKMGSMGRDARLHTERVAVGPTVKTPCRRLASKSGRAKCALCG